MRSILSSLLLLLFAGCSAKYCGVDEEVFKSFDKEKQAKICQEYLQQEAKLEKIRQQRALIEAQNRKKELALEELKLKERYKSIESAQSPYGIVDVTIEGSIGHKKLRKAAPVATTLADGEAQKICLHSSYTKGCFWIAYYQRRLFINPLLPYEKRRKFDRFIIDSGELGTSKDTIIIPVYKGQARVVQFKDGWLDFHLRIDIHPLFSNEYR